MHTFAMTFIQLIIWRVYYKKMIGAEMPENNDANSSYIQIQYEFSALCSSYIEGAGGGIRKALLVQCNCNNKDTCLVRQK